MAEQLDQNVVAMMKALAQHESGNKAVLPQEKGIGGASIYQYTTSTWKAAAKKFLGDENAPLNRANENKATYFRIKEWKDKGFKPAQIASMWNAGEGEPNAYTGKFSSGSPAVGVNSYGVKYNVPAHAKSVVAKFQKEIATLPKTEPTITPTTTPAPQPEEKKGFLAKVGSGLKTVGNIITSSEQALGKSLGEAAAYVTGTGKKVEQANQSLLDTANKTFELAKQTTDPARKQMLINQANEAAKQAGSNLQTVLPSSQKTAGQIYGEGLGVALDIGTAGALSSEAKSLKFMGAAEKALMAEQKAKQGLTVAQALAKNIEGTYKATTANKLLGIGSNVAKTATKGAAIGYGYDVSQGLQEGESLSEAVKPGVGAAVGAAVPVAFGAKAALNVLKKEGAPRVINSLVKPLLKDFSYGKNPGRAVAEEGIVANSLEDLGAKISSSREKIGREISNQNSILEGKALLNLEGSFKPIDDAMEIAAKNNNPTLLQRLQNVKDALTQNLTLGTDKSGKPTIISNGAKELKNAKFSEAFTIKKDIGDMTQWTGNASDDKAVNAALKKVYGNVRKTYLETADKVSPEVGTKLRTLSEKYADLTSAEVATKYRDKITERQNFLSLGNKAGAVGAVIAAVASGGTTIPVILAGISGAVLDKALASTAFKTRIARWMASESPGVLERFFAKNPQARNSIYKAFNESKNTETKEFLKNLKIPVGLSTQDVSKLSEKELGGFLKKVEGKVSEAEKNKMLTGLNKSTDLAKEAKKYKSADEFIKAQGTPVYHGGEISKLENKPLFTAVDDYIAKSYDPYGKLNEFYPAKNIKELDITTDYSKVKEAIKSKFDNYGKNYVENTWFDPFSSSKKKVQETYDKYISKYKNFDAIEKRYDTLKGESVVSEYEKLWEKDVQEAISYIRKLPEVQQEKVFEFDILDRVVKQVKDPSRDDIYANWKQILKYAKDNKYDSVKHITQSKDAQQTGIERIFIDPTKSIKTKSQLTDIWNKANKKFMSK